MRLCIVPATLLLPLLFGLAPTAVCGFRNSSVGTLHFGCNTTGPENATQLAQLARYSMPIIEFRHESVPHEEWHHEEAVLANQAAALAVAQPAGPRAWVYRNVNLGSMFALQRPIMTDPSRASWFLGPPGSDPKYNISWRSVNFSVPAAAKFYLDTVVGEAAKEPQTAGVFFDGIDGMACVPGGSATLLNDTLATFRQACELLRRADKGCILSVVNAFSDSGAAPRCPVSEEAMVEIMADTPFFRYYQHWMNGFVGHAHTPTSADTCAAMIRNVIAEGRRNIPVVVRAPSTASIDATDFSLALGGFLIGAAPGSTFGWGSCWFDECWPVPSSQNPSLFAPSRSVLCPLLTLQVNPG